MEDCGRDQLRTRRAGAKEVRGHQTKGVQRSRGGRSAGIPLYLHRRLQVRLQDRGHVPVLQDEGESIAGTRDRQRYRLRPDLLPSKVEQPRETSADTQGGFGGWELLVAPCLQSFLKNKKY